MFGLCAASVLAVGCGARPQVSQEFTVGVHRVTVVADEPWQHVDQGRRHLMRGEEFTLVAQDLGAVGREGIRHEVTRALTLWLRGQSDEGRTAMGMIPVSPEHFEAPDHRREFWLAWREASDTPSYLDTIEVRIRFRGLFEAIDGLRPRSLDAIVASGLRALDEDERRAIARQEPLKVDGRPGLWVETWNRVDHGNPRAFGFVLDDGYLLVVMTDRAAGPDALPALRATVESLRIAQRSGA